MLACGRAGWAPCPIFQYDNEMDSLVFSCEVRAKILEVPVFVSAVG